MKHYDLLILGQGLAGSCLAWAAKWAGQSCAVIDDPQPMTASRVAAGLITPITGRRLAKTWRLEEFWPVAVAFYQRVEKEAGRQLLLESPALRVFRDEAERDLFASRRAGFGEMMSVREVSPSMFTDALTAPWGGFEMSPAARLNVGSFLDATRQELVSRDAIFATRVSHSEIDVFPDRAVIRRLGVSGEKILLCQGVAAREEPLFKRARFNPAKGEILSVRIPDLQLVGPVHQGIWIARDKESLFRVGATYDWDRLDCEPTEQGRESLRKSLAELVCGSFDVVDHVAAVRPAAQDFRPMVGFHPERPRMGILNGLGSKGALQAPYFAEQLVKAAIDDGAGRAPAIDGDVAIDRFWRRQR